MEKGVFCAKCPQWLGFFVWLSTVLASFCPAADGVILQPGGQIGATLKAGDLLTVQLPHSDGRPALILVEQMGMDLVLGLKTGSGDLLWTCNSPIGNWGFEWFLLPEAVPDGQSMVLELKPAQAEMVEAPFQISWLTGARPQDQVFFESAEAVREAGSHYVLGRSGWPAAQKGYQSALDVIAAFNTHPVYGDLLFNLGKCQRLTAKNSEAVASLSRAEAHFSVAKRPFHLAQTHNNLGSLAHRKGQYNRALDFYQRALPKFEALNDLPWQAVVNLNMGNIYDVLGEPGKAIQYAEKALALYRELGFQQRQAWALNDKGVYHRRAGEWQQALKSYQEALALGRAGSDARWQARTLNNIGFAYLATGQAKRALTFFEQALPLRLQARDRRGEGVTLNHMGRAYGLLQNWEKALGLYGRALAVHQASNYSRGEVAAWSQLGETQALMGDHHTALESCRRALAILERVKNPRSTASVLKAMGASQLELGHSVKAKDTLARAAALFEQIDYLQGQAEISALLGWAAQKQGLWQSAAAHYGRFFEQMERLRGNIGDHQSRMAFFAATRQTADRYVDVLLALDRQQPSSGFASQALVLSERTRARELLELLNKAGARLEQGVHPALLDRQQQLRRKLNALTQQQRRLANRVGETAAIKKVSGEIGKVLADWDLLDVEMMAANPRRREIYRPTHLNLTQIQQLADEHTLILEYFLGETQSVLWVIGQGIFESHVLPPKAQLQSLVSQVIREWSTLDGRPNASRAASQLAGHLLGPLKDMKASRLAIVPDGFLHGLPFGALPLPRHSADGPGRGSPKSPFLVEHVEIVFLPSAAALAMFRERAGHEHHPKRGLQIAVMADPVFDANDPRVARRGEAPHQHQGDVYRGGGEESAVSFARLPWSRQEAEVIASFSPKSVKLALDFDASLRPVLAGQWRDAAILHFATHGVLDQSHPELSAMVLSLVDRQGQPRDGFLRLQDIYNLDLSARLVVLSGCQTAAGKPIAGEGLIGLARGFQHAGASAVTASLWQISDKATAELMKHFYTALLRDELPPAAALRKAQLALVDQRRWRHPFFWASFVHIGDWR